MNKVNDKIPNKQIIPEINDYLMTWIEGFMIDRNARGLTENTLLFYTRKLNQFDEFAETQAVTRLSQLETNLIRQYLLWMETTGHNPGGVLTAFRAVKSFLLWYETETDEVTPIHKIKASRVDRDPLEGVSLGTVKRMVKACEHGTFTGDRMLPSCLVYWLEITICKRQMIRLLKKWRTCIYNKLPAFLNSVLHERRDHAQKVPKNRGAGFAHTPVFGLFQAIP